MRHLGVGPSQPSGGGVLCSSPQATVLPPKTKKKKKVGKYCFLLLPQQCLQPWNIGHAKKLGFLSIHSFIHQLAKQSIFSAQVACSSSSFFLLPFPFRTPPPTSVAFTAQTLFVGGNPRLLMSSSSSSPSPPLLPPLLLSPDSLLIWSLPSPALLAQVKPLPSLQDSPLSWHAPRFFFPPTSPARSLLLMFPRHFFLFAAS